MASETLRRAGFWRRLIAHLVDAFCVALLFSLLAGLLYGVSHGTVQMISPGLRFIDCRDVTSLPKDLYPAPPADSNFAFVCSSYFLAGQTGKGLTVGSRTQESGVTHEFYIYYPLDADGQPGNSVDVSWITPLALLSYIILAQHRFRQTLGLRLVRSRMVRTDNALADRIPLTRLAIRYAVLFAGYIPAFAAAAITMITAMYGSAAPLTIFVGIATALILAAIWWLWNVILIARKRDPIYDRVARTAIVRIEKPATSTT